MTSTRRQFLQTAAAGALAGALPQMTWAQQQVQLGTKKVISLSDGALSLPAEFIFGPMPQDELAGVLQPFGMAPDSPLTPPCNVTLMKDGDRVVLFDVGAGNAFQSSAGQLMDALDAADVAPEDVTHVVFTHAHPDHLWGVLDDFDDPLFVNAEHMIGEAELAYWMDPATVDSIGAARTAFAVGAQRRLDTLQDSLQTFAADSEILPGVFAHSTPGHTPGHTSFELRDGSNALMVVGDAIGNHHVAFARPDWVSGSDQDLDLAAKTRVRLLDQMVADQMQMIGYHFKGDGVGRAERNGNGYRFIAGA